MMNVVRGPLREIEGLDQMHVISALSYQSVNLVGGSGDLHFILDQQAMMLFFPASVVVFIIIPGPLWVGYKPFLLTLEALDALFVRRTTLASPWN